MEDNQYIQYIQNRILKDLEIRKIKENSPINKGRLCKAFASSMDGPAKKIFEGLGNDNINRGRTAIAQIEKEIAYWNKAIKTLMTGSESKKKEIREKVDIAIHNEQLKLDQERATRLAEIQKAAEEARQVKMNRLKEIRTQPLSDKNRWVSVALAVFLGFLGAEYFYMRRFISAAIQLSCLVVFMENGSTLALLLGVVLWIIGIFREIDGKGKWMAFDKEDIKKREEEKLQLERELNDEIKAVNGILP